MQALPFPVQDTTRYQEKLKVIVPKERPIEVDKAKEMDIEEEVPKPVEKASDIMEAEQQEDVKGKSQES